MYKLLLTDLDDTLLNSKGKISDENKLAIQAAVNKGCHVVICSGRSNMSLEKFNNFLEINDYTIGYNGGIIYKGNEILVCHYLEKELVKNIIDFCRKFKVSILLYQHEEPWVENKSLYIREYCRRSALKPHVVSDLTEHITDEVNKIILLASRKHLDEIVNTLPENISSNCCTFFSHSNLFEFNPLNVTKGTALRELAEKLEIPIEETIAVGDNENDLPMIIEAGLGVAVKNAIPLLHENAKYITENDCDNSPIAEIIKKFIL